MSKVILITTGGTGGHIFPAEALSEELISQGYSVFMAVDQRYRHFGTIDNERVFLIDCFSFSGTIANKISALFSLFLSFFSAIFLLFKLKPQLVIGFGSYASFPVCLASVILRKKLIIHEQNAVLGKVNKFFASSAHAIATSFSVTSDINEKFNDKVFYSGNPIRKEIRKLANVEHCHIKENSNLRIFVTGGSQGSQIFSSIFSEAISNLPEEYKKRLIIVQQCRGMEVDKIQEYYKKHDVSAELAPFFYDIGDRMIEADLVIARAGATTIAELSFLGKPALLVPIRDSVKNHQLLNAKYIVSTGGVWMIEEKSFNIENIQKFLIDILDDPQKLNDKLQEISCNKIDGAQNLAKFIIEKLQ